MDNIFHYCSNIYLNTAFIAQCISYYRDIKASLIHFNRALLENWICKKEAEVLDQGT